MVTSIVAEGVYRKTAPAGERRHQLGHEGRLLSAIRHPGVVSLMADPGERPTELVLGLVAHGDLGTRTFPPSEVAGIGAAVATTLADLHDLGVVYGGCAPQHVLLDNYGSPVLCSFGRAQFETDESQRLKGQRHDVAALINVLLGLLDDEGGGLRRQLQRAARQRQPSARSLARMLAAVSGARLPAIVSEPPAKVAAPGPIVFPPLDDPPPDGSPLSPLDDPGDLATSYATTVPPDEELVLPPLFSIEPPDVGRPRSRRSPSSIKPGLAGSDPPLGRSRRGLVSSRWAMLVAAAAVMAVAAVVIWATRPGGGGAGVAGACPKVDAGCRPVPIPDGVLTTPGGRWSLDQVGDVVVLGRWSCTKVALPALLQPSDGQVWVFDRWANDNNDVAARPLIEIPGATTLAVIPSDRLCDRLEVVGPSGHHTTLDPG